MTNPTLQAELDYLITNFAKSCYGNINIEKDEKFKKAILATVSKHLPKKSGKESEIKNIYGSPLGERIDMRKFKTGGTTDYINGRNSGYNTAITEMKKTLGGNYE